MNKIQIKNNFNLSLFLQFCRNFGKCLDSLITFHGTTSGTFCIISSHPVWLWYGIFLQNQLGNPFIILFSWHKQILTISILFYLLLCRNCRVFFPLVYFKYFNFTYQLFFAFEMKVSSFY